MGNIDNTTKTIIYTHTYTHTKSNSLLWFHWEILNTYVCVCGFCEGLSQSLKCCYFLWEKLSLNKSLHILTNVCFWGANGVLKCVTSLFKMLPFTLSLSRTNAVCVHRQSCRLAFTLSWSAFTATLWNVSSMLSSFPPLPVSLQITEWLK